MTKCTKSCKDILFEEAVLPGCANKLKSCKESLFEEAVLPGCANKLKNCKESLFEDAVLPEYASELKNCVEIPFEDAMLPACASVPWGGDYRPHHHRDTRHCDGLESPVQSAEAGVAQSVCAG